MHDVSVSPEGENAPRPDPRAEANCRNCGRPAGPDFCGYCGQELEARRGPLLTVLHEILDDWLSLDSRLGRTLAQLAVPGRLTERYLEGKRAAYVRPFRLYLLASVLLFSSLLSLRAPDATRFNVYIAGQLVTEAPAVKGRTDLSLSEPDSMIERWIMRRQDREIARLRSIPPQKLLDGLFAGLRRAMPSAFILFVPFLALGLKALYLRKRILYVDHLIFALHFQSALFLGLSAIWVLCRLLGLELLPSMVVYVLAGLLMLLIYLPLALHRVYRQRRRWTALKAVLLIFIYGQLLKLIGNGAVLLVTTTLS